MKTKFLTKGIVINLLGISIVSIYLYFLSTTLNLNFDRPLFNIFIEYVRFPLLFAVLIIFILQIKKELKKIFEIKSQQNIQ